MSSPMLDAIRTQVMWNRLISVVEEQAQALLRTAFGSVAREAGDLSAGVYDTQGRMLAQAVTGTPGHVNTMAVAVGHFLNRFPLEGLAVGDVLVTNDPWMGTGHLFDYVVVTPVLSTKYRLRFLPPPATPSTWGGAVSQPMQPPCLKRAPAFPISNWCGPECSTKM